MRCLVLVLIGFFFACKALPQTQAQRDKLLSNTKCIKSCYKAGNPSDAIPFFKSSIDILEKVGDKAALAESLENYAKLLTALHKNSEATQIRAKLSKYKNLGITENEWSLNESDIRGHYFQCPDFGFGRLAGTLKFSPTGNNVDISTKYEGVKAGTLVGTWELDRSYSAMPKLRIYYEYAGSKRVTTYSGRRENGKLRLYGGDEPLRSPLEQL